MSLLRFAAPLALATGILASAALGALLTPVWLVLVGLGASVQIHALWKRYHDG